MVNKTDGPQSLYKVLFENINPLLACTDGVNEADMKFALEYSKDALVSFALNLCTEDEKSRIKNDVEANLLLAYQLEGIAISIGNNNINSVEEYYDYMAKKFKFVKTPL